MRQGVQFIVGGRTELEVGKTIAVQHGNVVAFEGDGHGCGTSEDGGAFEDGPTIVFHLARGQDGLAATEVSTLVHHKDDGTPLGLDKGSSLDQFQVGDSVVMDANKRGVAAKGTDAAHVITNDATIGTTVDEGVLEAEVLSFGHANAVWCRQNRRGVPLNGVDGERRGAGTTRGKARRPSSVGWCRATSGSGRPIPKGQVGDPANMLRGNISGLGLRRT